MGPSSFERHAAIKSPTAHASSLGSTAHPSAEEALPSGRYLPTDLGAWIRAPVSWAFSCAQGRLAATAAFALRRYVHEAIEHLVAAGLSRGDAVSAIGTADVHTYPSDRNTPAQRALVPGTGCSCYCESPSANRTHASRQMAVTRATECLVPSTSNQSRHHGTFPHPDQT